MMRSGPSSSSSLGSPPVPYSTRPSSDSPHSRPLQISPSSSMDSQRDREFTPFSQMISGGSGSSTLGTASTGLESLRTLLEAVDTLPFVKYLASVGIQLLQYVIEAQITNDMFRSLAFRAKDIIVAVARSCHGMQTMAVQLEDDLRQLTSTMDSILAFASERVTRRTYQKLLSKADDAAAVKALNTQLTHAFHIFEIQSSVSTRLLQHEMVRQLSTMSVSPAPPRQEFVANCNLRVQEGIYIIKNIASNYVIETVDHKPFGGGGVHTYMAPSQNGKLQTQLWSIQKKANKEFEFMIRSMATGLSLDIFLNTNRQGAKVCAHSWNGGGNQTWSIWGTRQGVNEDYCTIRSTGLATILDSQCPKDRSKCDELHATAIPPRGPTASQEWNLIRISSLPTALSPQAHLPDVTFPRRPLLLQNVLTGMLATRTDNVHGPNVILSPSPTPTSAWTFNYAENHMGNVRTDCFAIASSSDNPCTMDHYGNAHINVSKYWLANNHHKWAPVARDGVFIFRNVASGALLAASRSRRGYVDTLPATAREDSACHWRILDATTNEHIRILYDSGLSLIPPELSGTPSSSPPIPMPLELRTGTATPEIRLAMLNSFAQEHDTIRAMLLEGYKALIVAPRMIAGWRDGKVRRVEVRDEEAEFRYRGHGSLEPCEPR
ncbi:hypothetical protein PENSPDRAFT_739249 [Peniophora sp. CONT]|nr:hypothetical protein PENSPDRAFT_739249 [Peniophora sp. CONT]